MYQAWQLQAKGSKILSGHRLAKNIEQTTFGLTNIWANNRTPNPMTDGLTSEKQYAPSFSKGGGGIKSGPMTTWLIWVSVLSNKSSYSKTFAHWFRESYEIHVSFLTRYTWALMVTWVSETLQEHLVRRAHICISTASSWNTGK